MIRYFHVENGQIQQGPRQLPKAWRNISGLDLLSDADLKPLGWLPEEKVGFKPFDPATQVRTGPTHQILAAKVRSTYSLRAKTAQELANEQRDDDLQALRDGGKDLALVVSELVAKLIEKGVIAAGDFTPGVRQTYQDVKAIADRVK